MARILGKPGRFVENQSIKRSRQYLLGLCIVMAIVSGLGGFYFGAARTIKQTIWVPLILAPTILACMFIFKRLADKRLDAIERERISFRKGAVGEALIAGVLEGLSDDYVVINDLTSQFGNIDHVVVGPTGVFVIDTKNWKGTVEADNNGELLLNGSPRPVVRNLVRTAMSCREQVINLCSSQRLQANLYVKAVIAFPITFVKVKWGTLKNVDCVTDESLVDYIEKNKSKEKLTKNDIDSISRAFEMLARMDKGFSDTASSQKVIS